jgi:hypothetical protein
VQLLYTLLANPSRDTCDTALPLARSVDHLVAIPLMELSKFRLFWPSRVCRVEWCAPRPEESENESKPSASFEPPTKTPHSNATFQASPPAMTSHKP